MKISKFSSIILFLLFCFSSSTFSQNTNILQSRQNSNTFVDTISSFTKSIYNSIKSFFIIEPPKQHSIIETQQGLQDNILFQSLSAIKEQIPPFIYNKYAIFTYYDVHENSSVHLISSSNNYKELHPFVRLESNKKVMVLLFPRDVSSIMLQYRIVINGVWGYDTNNPNTIVDPNGVTLSIINIPAIDNNYIPSFIPLGNNLVRFILSSKSFSLNLKSTAMEYTLVDITNANTIHINASFTGWDPFLLKMQYNTIIQGAYIADIHLSPGTHYYYFQVDGYSILDPKNKDIVRLKNGLYVNRIIIQDGTKRETVLLFPPDSKPK